jgi:uncharacterized repeat protein (TIGR03803 family)
MEFPVYAATTILVALLATGARVGVSQERVLYSYVLWDYSDPNASAAGSEPESGLIEDAKGNLYGTTLSGGANGFGTAFELTPGPGGAWTEKVLHSFGATGTDGIFPQAGLIFDTTGNLYGTTAQGGDGSFGLGGTVFELTPAPGGVWTEKVLHSFGATSTDGYLLFGSLIFDVHGNLYGSTNEGGSKDGLTNGYGTVFKLSPSASGNWTEKILYNFCSAENCADGARPFAGLVFDAVGNLYGTTYDGGTYSTGTAFELIPAAEGNWTAKVLHNFIYDGTDGFGSLAGLIFDTHGNLYGTTAGGGANSAGAIFELTPPSGGMWKEKMLYSFGATGKDGAVPMAGLIFDANGNLYGTTNGGGTYATETAGGTVFELTTAANGDWTEKVLHSFHTDDTDGNNPQGSLILGAAGNLYGTTKSGGIHENGGAVFEIASTAAAPRFSPAAGAYLAAQTATITDGTPTAAIYYTTNGDTPTASSTRYNKPIDVAGSETVKAIAIASGYFDSKVASATYAIAQPTAEPLLSPAAGTYPYAQAVKITDSTAGAAIYFTTGGQKPTRSSTRYSGPIEVSKSEEVEAIALAPGHTQSAVVSATYIIAPPASKPTFSPVGGKVAAGQIVKIHDTETKGLVVYYTTDGKTPTTKSTKYTSAGIKVTVPENIKAIAVATGFSESAIATATYTIK